MAPNIANNEVDLHRRQLRRKVKRASRRMVTYAQVIVAFGGLLLIVLLRVPWLGDVLKKIGFTDFGAVVQTVVVVVLVSVFFEVRALVDQTDDSGAANRHLADPMEVYPLLAERSKEIARSSEKTMDILGMTLYTAWPSIRFLINRPELNGWTVRLAAVLHNERRLAPYVPGSWFRDSRAHLTSVLECSKQQSIIDRGIRIEPYAYDFMPAIHGFRLGNGDLFYSVLHWQDDGKLGYDGYSYEFVPAEDKSPRAEATRETFDSWFRRATTTPWQGAEQAEQ